MPNNTKISKFISLVLRHKPEIAELTLDTQGWTSTQALIHGAQKNGIPLTLETLIEIVHTNDKQRFIFNQDKSKIRANQGHSITIDLNLQPQQPPNTLYHGTSQRSLPQIQSQGLKKMQRHHVHLTESIQTAQNTGSRYGKPHILEIQALQMHKDGYTFYKTENNVWLTDHIPTNYITSAITHNL